ncbi:G-box-binding factor, putative, partial [Entamoeba histolytica HM-1:IMSS]
MFTFLLIIVITNATESINNTEERNREIIRTQIKSNQYKRMYNEYNVHLKSETDVKPPASINVPTKPESQGVQPLSQDGNSQTTQPHGHEGEQHNEQQPIPERQPHPYNEHQPMPEQNPHPHNEKQPHVEQDQQKQYHNEHQPMPEKQQSDQNNEQHNEHQPPVPHDNTPKNDTPKNTDSQNNNNQNINNNQNNQSDNTNQNNQQDDKKNESKDKNKEKDN